MCLNIDADTLVYFLVNYKNADNIYLSNALVFIFRLTTQNLDTVVL